MTSVIMFVGRTGLCCTRNKRTSETTHTHFKAAEFNISHTQLKKFREYLLYGEQMEYYKSVSIFEVLKQVKLSFQSVVYTLSITIISRNSHVI